MLYKKVVCAFCCVIATCWAADDESNGWELVAATDQEQVQTPIQVKTLVDTQEEVQAETPSVSIALTLPENLIQEQMDILAIKLNPNEVSAPEITRPTPQLPQENETPKEFKASQEYIELPGLVSATAGLIIQSTANFLTYLSEHLSDYFQDMVEVDNANVPYDHPLRYLG